MGRLVLEDGSLELAELMAEIFREVWERFEEGDGETFGFVMDDNERFGSVELLEVDATDVSCTHIFLKIAIWFNLLYCYYYTFQQSHYIVIHYYFTKKIVIIYVVGFSIRKLIFIIKVFRQKDS
jgi:hypothetical protein